MTSTTRIPSALVPSYRALVVGAGFQYSDMMLKFGGFGNWFFTPGPVIMPSAVGGAVMALLMIVQQRYTWWPFHPISFPISMAVNKMFFTVLLAWVIKSAVLRYGGPRLFMQLRPFFLGLILGEFIPAGLLAMIEVAGGLP